MSFLSTWLCKVRSTLHRFGLGLGADCGDPEAAELAGRGRASLMGAVELRKSCATRKKTQADSSTPPPLLSKKEGQGFLASFGF